MVTLVEVAPTLVDACYQHFRTELEEVLGSTQHSATREFGIT